MKKAMLFAVLLLSSLALAQGEAPIATRRRFVGIASGTTQKIMNPSGALLPTFAYTITGAPSTVSIVLKGCMTGDTDAQNCATLETDTTTTASQIRTFPTNTTAYDYFLITPTFTGGTSPTLTINSTLPPFAKAGGGGAPSGAAGGALAGTYPNPTLAVTPVASVSAQFSTTDTVACPNNTTGNFATSYTIPANYLVANKVLRVTLTFTLQTSSSPPSMGLNLLIGGTQVVAPLALAASASINNRPVGMSYLIQGTAAAGASVPVITSPISPAVAATTVVVPFGISTISPPVSLATNGTLAITPQLFCSVNTAGNGMTLQQMLVEAVN